MKKFINDYIRYNTPFLILVSVAVIMLIVAFILPPTAIVDKSILEAVAEIMGMMSLWTIHSAVVKGKVGKFRHGSTEVVIEPKKEQEEEEEK